MSVGRILTQGLGSPFSGVRYLVTLGLGTAGTPPVPPAPVSLGGGGGGRIWIGKKRLKNLREEVGEWVDVTLREMYAETKEVPAAKGSAAKLVKPYAEGRKKTPAEDAVDWAALQADAERSQKLIALWWDHVEKKRIEDEIEREDEMILFGIKH